MNRIFIKLGLSTLLLFAIAAANSEIVTDKGLDSYPVPETKSQAAPMPSETKHLLGSRHSNTLKCWQEGQLVLNEENWQVEFLESQIEFRRSDHERLSLFQHGNTFCIYRGEL